MVSQAQAAALGLFSGNLGRVGGLFGTLTYLIVAATMSVVGTDPESTQAPLGWIFVGCGLAVFAVLAAVRRIGTTSRQTCDDAT